jgi:signal recognition particle GTPase
MTDNPNSRLDGFNDPQYRADAAALEQAKSKFDHAYYAKLISEALNGALTLEDLPDDVRKLVAMPGGVQSLIDIVKGTDWPDDFGDLRDDVDALVKLGRIFLALFGG